MVVDSIINAWTSKKNTDKTIQANKELAKYSYEKDLEMWNRANEYNSPQQQMSRLSSAGLNPNLVYGSGSVSGNTSGSLPSYNAPRVDYNYKPPFQLGGVLQQYQDFKLKQAQIDNVEENTANTKQRTANESVNNALLGLKLSTGQATQPYTIEKSGWDAFKSRYFATAEQWRSDYQKYQAQAKQIQNQYLDRLLSTQVLNAQSQVNRNLASTRLLDEQTKNYGSKTYGLDIQNKYMDWLQGSSIFNKLSGPIAGFLLKLLK